MTHFTITYSAAKPTHIHIIKYTHKKKISERSKHFIKYTHKKISASEANISIAFIRYTQKKISASEASEVFWICVNLGLLCSFEVSRT